MTYLLDAAYCISPKAYKKLPNILEETKVIRNNIEGPFLDQQKSYKSTGRSSWLSTVKVSQPGCVLMFTEFDTSINTSEKEEKAEK